MLAVLCLDSDIFGLIKNHNDKILVSQEKHYFCWDRDESSRLSREESVWARSSQSPNWDGHGLNHNENKSESTEGEVENIFGHSISSFSRF